MTATNFNQYPCLTPVRVVAISNQTGTYSNGTLNNGVGATFTYATGALTIDSVIVNLNDSVLLEGQTNKNENGIYICTQQGATGVSAVLTRRNDLQCIEQLLLGGYVSVSAGTVNAGAIYAFVEPKPAHFGVDELLQLKQLAIMLKLALLLQQVVTQSVTYYKQTILLVL